MSKNNIVQAALRVPISIVLTALWSLGVLGATIPSFHLKVVDSETGEAQEWVRVELYAYKTIGTLGGEVDVTLYQEVMYFNTTDGLITTPERSFLVLDVTRYKGFEIIISSPGHNKTVLKKQGGMLVSHSTACPPVPMKGWRESAILSVSLHEWRSTDGPDLPPYFDRGEVSLKDKVLSGLFEIKCYGYLLNHWDQYYFKDSIFEGGAGRSDPKKVLNRYLNDYLSRISWRCGQWPESLRNYKEMLYTDARDTFASVREKHPDLVETLAYAKKYPFLQRGKQ